MTDFWRDIYDWCQSTTTDARLAEPSDLVGLDAEDIAGRRALADLIQQRGFNHEQIVSRDHDAHATGSALVVSSRGVLLHFHKKFERWLQPGGHIEHDELADACACRETLEETGVPATHPADGPTLLSVDDHPAGAHRHLDLLYLLVAPPVDPRPNDDESPLVKWFPIAQAMQFIDFKNEPRLPHNLARAHAWCQQHPLPS